MMARSRRIVPNDLAKDGDVAPNEKNGAMNDCKDVALARAVASNHSKVSCLGKSLCAKSLQLLSPRQEKLLQIVAVSLAKVRDRARQTSKIPHF
jgi:hypothetical protein